MKDQKQKKKKQLGVEGKNPNVESPKKFTDASLVSYPVKADDQSLSNDDSYFESLPPGFRFKPYDGELVFHYLLRKILNQTLPPNQIQVVELYRFNPDTLTERYKPLGEMEWYFFTPRDRKYKNGKRPNRAAADGYWKATRADRPVKHNGKLVGFKKALVFYKGKAPKGDKTNWIMHEYIVNNPPQKQKHGDDMRLDNWVLCRIYKKMKQSAKGSTQKQENSGQDKQLRNEVPTKSQDNGQISVRTLPTTRDIFKPESHGISDVSNYDNQGRFFSAYDNVILSCQSPFVNFQNGQINFQNWLPSIPQSYHSPLGFQQMLHHSPSSVAESSTARVKIQKKDETSRIKHEQFGYLPDELLNLPLEDICFDPLAPNFMNF